MSKKIARGLSGLVCVATAWMKPYRRQITRALVCERMAQTASVEVDGQALRFRSATARGLHDVASLGTAEPETVAWLKSLGGGTLWDIGANVGVYSLYAFRLGLSVVSFEPSAATYGALVDNIDLNDAGQRIFPFCAALLDKTGLDKLWMTNPGAGHSMHQLGDPGTRAFPRVVSVFAADDFRRIFDLPYPDWIKIDIDGQDCQVLKGATAILARARSVIIEAETEKAETQIADFLSPLGYRRRAMDRHARNLVFDRAGNASEGF